MILTQFNTEVTSPTPAVPVAEVLPLTPASYTSGGNTALFDAIAQTVGRADAEKRPGERVLCLIIIDGEENSSRETTLEQVRTIIREREGRGDWTFAYLGAAPRPVGSGDGHVGRQLGGLLYGRAPDLVPGGQRGDAPASRKPSGEHEDLLRPG